MINTLIFSKDRPAQLELLLRSIRENFTELNDITILYLATSLEFQHGYNLLMKEYSHLHWLAEINFVKQTKAIVNNFRKDFFLCLVDDEVVIRSTPIKPLLELLRTPNYHCASLRLGQGMNYCYTANLPMFSPALIEVQSNILEWDWSVGDKRVDWGYPSCLNSQLVPMGFARWMVNLPFNGVNELETAINNQRDKFRHKMICFDKAKTINIANNITQTGTNRFGKKPEYTLESLNKMFLTGKRISTENIYNITLNCPTIEWEYRWY